ncbi:PAS modulated sigma54 specific transcriptional regulator, Fis family [Candidatus Vecturithrix granuli]|uniref:PAS modulated sigma54 specific transcriptional regulator, Fis family n=1 Tax=Vecturithrix granuli TaxID=1499967 RepID=A0A081BV29_VECG1|nr:PAS modulated sigma54 specific transcriptional regulator, Fis family [Candidatus Vecturithrix granuli]
MNILLIEANLKTLEGLRERICALGYDVTACKDAETALEAYQQTFYPLIVLDGTSDGFALCHRIRDLSQGDQSIILLMSDRHQPEDLQAALEAGVDDYLIKPVSPELLTLRLTVSARQFQNLTHRRQTEELLSNALGALQKTEEQLRIHNEELLASNAELRRIQEQLEASRQKYADLYDIAPVGYCTFDEDGIVLEANLTIAKLLGVERGLLISSRFYHFIVEEDRDRFFLYLRTLFAKKAQQTCELRLITRDGSLFFAQFETMVLAESDEQVILYRSAISDITERKRMEEELQGYRHHLEELVEKRTVELSKSEHHLRQEINGRQRADQAVRTSEQQYRLLAENVADGIGIFQKGKLVFVNNALTSILRYRADQLINMDAVELVREKYQEPFRKQFERYEHDVIPQDWQVACLAGDGSEVWVELRHVEIEWEGQPAILATMRDISARKLREIAIEKERAHLRRENLQLRSAIEDRARFGELVGKSPAMQAVYAQIVTAAAVDANVLISGESGTGKELAARTIHQISPRRNQEFVAVNCGAIPENLFEREFFGHRKGAFTGAEKDIPGFFDRAHKGTLFLDEIGELTPNLQVKLLRVLESGEYTPVGDNRSRRVDMRLIAATNKNLETLVTQGIMRDDFFYRIYVLSITMPPLREHPEDIPLLIEDFLQQHYDKKREPRPSIPDYIVAALSQRTWPGNVRELYNALQRYFHDEHRVEFRDTPGPRAVNLGEMGELDLKSLGFREAVETFEKRVIAYALTQQHDNMAKTAANLGIPLRTLYRKIKKYHLQ